MKWLLKRYMVEQHIDTLAELARMVGMTRKMLYDRIANPNTLRLYEIMALDKVLKFSDEDLIRLAKGDI